MIEANELRIGNIVKVEHYMSHNGIAQITSFTGDICHWKCRNNITPDMGWLVSGSKCDDIDPIPLTPEILEKAGFEEYAFGYTLQLGLFKKGFRWIAQDLLGNPLEMPFLRIDTWSCEIYYVHQLQNLYWCLVGKELEINL